MITKTVQLNSYLYFAVFFLFFFDLCILFITSRNYFLVHNRKYNISKFTNITQIWIIWDQWNKWQVIMFSISTPVCAEKVVVAAFVKEKHSSKLHSQRIFLGLFYSLQYSYDWLFYKRFHEYNTNLDLDHIKCQFLPYSPANKPMCIT